MKKSLVLTGMMGVGKSTVGKLLSRRLSKKFIDVDKIIENDQKLSIRDIFKTKGEQYFRDLEKKISLQYLLEKDLVIALGGGAFINSKIRERVLKNAISFWLDLDQTSLIKRTIRSYKRPLISKKDANKSILEIYKKRKKIYSLANHRINCENLKKNVIVTTISDIYETY